MTIGGCDPLWPPRNVCGSSLCLRSDRAVSIGCCLKKIIATVHPPALRSGGTLGRFDRLHSNNHSSQKSLSLSFSSRNLFHITITLLLFSGSLHICNSPLFINL